MKRLLLALTCLALLTSACAQATPLTQPQPDSVSSTESSPLTPETPHVELETPAYISFIVNVHDWTHPDESADVLLTLVDLFEKYNVRGDFYFTAEITRELAENHPEVIERFKNSNMTISYHVRPPHPLYTGFDSRLNGLSDDELYQTLLDYETYALNLETGELDRSQPGGYTYVAQIFGRNPIVAPAPNGGNLKDAAQKVYTALGAQMTLLYHEEGTELEQPFEYVNGLLVRPSDFSVTRVASVDESDRFWWNFVTSPDAATYNPTKMLQDQLTEWVRQTSSLSPSRAPFITALIHENNFYRSGPEGWKSFYYEMDGAKRGDPLSPPYDLSAPDPSTPRTEADKAAIFAAYEELVAYAAAHLTVVTSEDILEMAK